MLEKFRLASLGLAEAFDSWRVTPRLILIAYAILVLSMFNWYKTIPTYVKETCDVAVLQTLVINKIPIELARKSACTVVDVVGGPTGNQTTLVTTIIGLSSLVFGLYTNSGRKWEQYPPERTKITIKDNESDKL